MHNLKRINKNYQYFFCIEIFSLFFLAKVNKDLTNTIYCSMESSSFMNSLGASFCYKLLERCKLVTIQSETRKKDLENYLGGKLSHPVYIPVSILPVESARRIKLDSETKKIKIIYSGYFSEWSGLFELTESFIEHDSPLLKSDIEYVIHGHCMGTESYYFKIADLIKNQKSIMLDNSYRNDDDHNDFLGNFDIGLAYYKIDNEDDINWKNLLFSSGKIATYLWAGLAVITNIENEYTKQAPFLYISSPNEIGLAIQKFSENRTLFRKEAFKFANMHFNLQHYLDKYLLKRIS